MIIKKIDYRHSLTALGRNGTMYCKSLSIMTGNNSENIYFEPVNSRNKTGVCYIMFPVEKIDELIEVLKEIKNEQI